MGEENMKVNATQFYTLRIYLHRKRRPIILEGLTKEEVDNFNTNATSKMFIKYGPVLIRSEAIDYVIILQK